MPVENQAKVNEKTASLGLRKLCRVSQTEEAGEGGISGGRAGGGVCGAGSIVCTPGSTNPTRATGTFSVIFAETSKDPGVAFGFSGLS